MELDELLNALPNVSDDTLKRNGLSRGDRAPRNDARATTARPAKYHNARTEAKGLVFQSGHEAAVIRGFILAEEQHKIGGLRLQVRFLLPGGVVYVADATYFDMVLGLTFHVIDAKGYRTREYRNKAKQFKAIYGREIEEL